MNAILAFHFYSGFPIWISFGDSVIFLVAPHLVACLFFWKKRTIPGVVPKEDGGMWPTIDLKPFNKSLLDPPHFASAASSDDCGFFFCGILSTSTSKMPFPVVDI